jgi:hypothetical protein
MISLIQPGIELTIYHILGKLTNHCTTDALTNYPNLHTLTNHGTTHLLKNYRWCNG